jgi:Leucine-rich repeat (LRR) protein
MANDRDIMKQLQRRLPEREFHSGKRCINSTHDERCVYNERGQLIELHLCFLQLTQVPPEIWQCSSLQKLCLSENQLSTLPEELSQLTALQQLGLSSNELSTLPVVVCQLTTLQGLNLLSVSLSTLPAEMGQLIALHWLDLSYNRLSTLPEELSQLTALQKLGLSGNQLSTLPAVVCQLTALQELDLDGNQLSTLPAEMGQLTALQELDLSENQLSTLPAEMGQLTALQELDLDNNPLQSPLLDMITQGLSALLAYLRTLQPVKIFYCYAHEDRALRDRIDKHLSGLKRQGHIVVWYDREIQAGMEWEHEIERRLSTSHIILLLVSADFMSSDYCYGKEMQRALEMHEQGKVRVLPILLRPVDWQDAPFAKLQILPTGALSITEWQNQDKALADVAQQIRVVVTILRTSQG